MRFRLLFFLLFFAGQTTASAWTRISGEPIEGEPAVILYEEKSVWFARSRTQGDGEMVATKDLSLRDRQKLLVSPLFYKSFPEKPAWSREKRNLLLLWFLSPVVALYVGFWIAAMIVARKYSPLRAFYGFAGGWILGMLMFSLYLYFASRIGGGALTVLFGTGLAFLLLSFYISAVYSIDLFKGLLIFLLQLFVAAFLSTATLLASEAILDRHEIERFWNERIFAPVGLIEDPNPFPANQPNDLVE